MIVLISTVGNAKLLCAKPKKTVSAKPLVQIMGRKCICLGFVCLVSKTAVLADRPTTNPHNLQKNICASVLFALTCILPEKQMFNPSIKMPSLQRKSKQLITTIRMNTFRRMDWGVGAAPRNRRGTGQRTSASREPGGSPARSGSGAARGSF